MKLKPIIASYSGEASSRIRQYLDERALDIIAHTACSPGASSEIASDTLAELISMHVLKEQAGLATLDTSVFLRPDIERIVDVVTPLAQELSQLIMECGSAFRNAPPEVTIFLAGIIGLVQGVGANLPPKHRGVDWKQFPGKYEQSKVDFDEVCDALDAIGPDYLNKGVLPGERYTAVFIGPGGNTFPIFTQATYNQSKYYMEYLNCYLVDAYAMLATGEIQHESLRASAEAANMVKQGGSRTAIITNETIREYEGAIQAIISTASSYYAGKLDTFETLLCSTTAGRQGVPAANMMLNFWRYMRKLTARELYRCGFFTDTIPEEGTLTVFYDNNVELVRQLLM